MITFVEVGTAYVLLGLGVSLIGNYLQTPVPNDTILTLLIQAPIVAAFIWFTLQLAKLQQSQLKAHQDALEKTIAMGREERSQISEQWRDWMGQQNQIFLNFLAEERAHRQQLVATVSTDIRSMEETLKKLSSQIDLAEEVLTRLPVMHNAFIAAITPHGKEGDSK